MTCKIISINLHKFQLKSNKQNQLKEISYLNSKQINKVAEWMNECDMFWVELRQKENLPSSVIFKQSITEVHKKKSYINK